MTSSEYSAEVLANAKARSELIAEGGFDIYANLGDLESMLYYPDDELEARLFSHLQGVELGGPIRTRSKLAKQLVAEALGYGKPSSFKKTRPRFPGQDLDVHVQQDDNLQIWNQEVSPERRYVLIRPDSNDIVQRVRVVRGQQVAQWDRTGTLTSKFQAKRVAGRTNSQLVSQSDTHAFEALLAPEPLPGTALAGFSSSDPPVVGSLMPIAQVFTSLQQLVGTRIARTGPGQDRVRGELLQIAVSEALGLGHYANFGQWPDIVNQALEVKLQTSPTIDLGLVLPTDESPARALGPGLRHCDARYAVVYGELLPTQEVEIMTIVVSTGLDFFTEFVQFGGLVKNSKRQIRLPADLL